MTELSLNHIGESEKIFHQMLQHSEDDCLSLGKAGSGKVKDIYDQLWTMGVEKLVQHSYVTDPYIQSANDGRRGLSLILRPSAAVIGRIDAFLELFKKMEPDQYYYKPEDFHITFLSLISCQEGFFLPNIEMEKYIAALDDLFKNKAVLTINHQGITVSDSCVMVQGFCPENLNMLRNEVREVVATYHLTETMDKRYLLRTAHSTVIRYAKKIKDPEAWLELLGKYRNEPFGFSDITHIDLVVNDWYMKRENLIVIKSFALQKTS